MTKFYSFILINLLKLLRNITENDYLKIQVDSRLKSWSASAKEPDRRFEDMKHYGDNLGSNVAAMIKVRQVFHSMLLCDFQ